MSVKRGRHVLQIPGLTNVPDRIRRSLSRNGNTAVKVLATFVVEKDKPMREKSSRLRLHSYTAGSHLSEGPVAQAIKGKTSHHLLQDCRRLRATFWGRHLWGRGYFVRSSGNVTDEAIAEYIRLQGPSPRTTTASK